MLKNLIQQLVPSFILKKYKQEKFYRLIRDFNIENEPDLIIAQKLCTPKQTVIDIGANIGLYSKFLSPLASKVLAVEPVPFTFQILSKNIERFKIENVTLYNNAISDHIGKALITVPIQSGVRNYFRASISSQEDDDDQSIHSVPIETTTLDSLCLDHAEKISLIKCDVEGHELQCVLGAEQIVKSHSPAWLIEISDDPDKSASSSFQLFELMKKNRYRIFWFDGDILFERKTGDDSVNYFFLNNSHIDLLIKTGVGIIKL
ncbi:MAG: FkbM family methyltransferase [Balneola sp.]